MLGLSLTFTPLWVQHKGSKLTACRCSSSYMGGQKHQRRKKGLKRRGQRQSELEKVAIIKEEEAVGKVRLVTARTDTGRCEVKKKKGNFALMCDHAENNEQSVCVCVCVSP